MIALLLAAPSAARAPLEARLRGDVRSFFVATFPTRQHRIFMPDGDPSGQATFDVRLKLEAAYEDVLRFDLHHAATALSRGGTGLGVTTGSGTAAPEAVDLSWRLDDTGELDIIGRVDRAVLAATAGPVDIGIGRQPVSFGTGLVFTPMDLVNPFPPTTIDAEYKPGVDALRIDGYSGTGGQVTAVAAYAGDWDPDGLVLAAAGRVTVGVTDLTGLLALSHGEPVGGLGTVSSVGPVGVHADATFTVPADDPAFVRAVAGADGRPTATTTVAGEVYVQTFGASDPDGYMDVARSDRFLRGEIWQMGRTYAALTGAQEITPLVIASLALVANVEDPSALLAPALSWSVAADAEVALGAFAGLGRRPEAPAPDAALYTVGPTGPVPVPDFGEKLGVTSEFGLVPVAFFAQMKAYF